MHRVTSRVMLLEIWIHWWGWYVCLTFFLFARPHVFVLSALYEMGKPIGSEHVILMPYLRSFYQLDNVRRNMDLDGFAVGCCADHPYLDRHQVCSPEVVRVLLHDPHHRCHVSVSFSHGGYPFAHKKTTSRLFLLGALWHVVYLED